MSLRLSEQNNAPVSGAGGSRPRGGWKFAGVTATAVGTAALLATVDPNQPGHYPTCPLLFTTGLYCPGCGTLRAIHATAHGDLVGAWDRNPLFVIMVPVLVAAWVMWGLRLLGKTDWNFTRLHPRWTWILLTLIVAFWIARNIPGWSWLSPA